MMCMKKFDAGLTNLQGFELSHFPTSTHIGLGLKSSYIVKSISLTGFSGSFQYFADMLQPY